MPDSLPIISDSDFVTHYIRKSPHMMWFLGAGTSVSAGMPTATDIIWDLKTSYYCAQENQEIQRHDIHNLSVRGKIQAYMDSKGFPALWSSEEYSFYFDLFFGNDYSAQQQYIRKILSPDKISLNIGQKILAALIGLGDVRVVFTTNFDSILEQAFSYVNGKNLSPFHIEGSYAALDALNNENYPIYVKLHGDFQYQSIKNLKQDLVDNDLKLQECFIKAANRFGLVVSGYSGRDKNVMSMLHNSLSQAGAFPHGIYWVVRDVTRDISENIKEFVCAASKLGINAFIVESGNFDILLNKIWRQVQEKPDEVDSKIKRMRSKIVSIPLPKQGTQFPIIRMNALPITSIIGNYAEVQTRRHIRYDEFKELAEKFPNRVISVKTDKILACGSSDDFNQSFSTFGILSITRCQNKEMRDSILSSTIVKSLCENALALSLAADKPLILRKRFNQYYIIVDKSKINDPKLNPLKDALQYQGRPGYISGGVKDIRGVSWCESVRVDLETRNSKSWLMLRPDIWIEPDAQRENCSSFLRQKRNYRLNRTANDLLSAWVKILIGELDAKEHCLTCFPDKEFNISFTINSRNAFSRKVVAHV